MTALEFRELIEGNIPWWLNFALLSIPLIWIGLAMAFDYFRGEDE